MLHDKQELLGLAEQVRALREAGSQLERELAPDLALVCAGHRPSAANLLHYLAVRQRDIRDLQWRLHALGLSSLGRLEASVHANLDAVLAALLGLAHVSPAPEAPAPLSFEAGGETLLQNTRALFGADPPRRAARVMVTFDTAEAEPYPLLEQLLQSGMNVLRLNCSKDDEAAWLRCIAALRRAERSTGCNARVLCDLPGPNPRTGPLAADPIALSPGDQLRLRRGAAPGHGARLDPDGRVLEPASIGCDLPAVLDGARVGARVLFDDGRLETVVQEVEADGSLLLGVTRARKGRAKLKPDRSINLPETPIELPGLTEVDLRALDFATAHADLVGLSFVRDPRDVLSLISELDQRGASRLGVILKIETQGAFRELARILLAAMRRQAPLGVMVARGDMGVELGFERMAEAQEEVLWLAEAAHVPVVWATQVLESLAKKGIPSRGEVTDAAMGGRAECVMLNKGANIVATTRFLCDVLERMQAHQHKKVQLMRQLGISRLS